MMKAIANIDVVASLALSNCQFAIRNRLSSATSGLGITTV
jgi:hypothetical protein